MKLKKLVFALLIVFALVVSSGTYAYWASNIKGPEDETTTGTVIIGEGKEVITSFVLTGNTTTGGQLVPATQLSNSATGAVSKVTLSYNVEWKEDNTTTQLTGTTSTANITITPVVSVTNATGADVSTLVSKLINVTPSASNPSSLTLDQAASTFNFDITMIEPANQEEYNAIVNGTITITITYSLGAISTTDNK